jgi:hypothetical protein
VIGAVAAVATALAIVTQDNTPLRAAPANAAAVHAQLAAGDLVELRGERLDHLRVYDHRRERAGYVRATQLRRVAFAEADAPALLAVVRFVRDTPGAEALGIAYVAAYLKAAPAGAIDAEPFDALGVMAERMARRASSSGPAPRKAAVAALETVAQYGVTFTSYERNGTLTLCYEGEAFRRVLAQPADAEQLARAALALSRADCIDPALPPLERAQHDRWRAETLDRLDAAAFAALSEISKQRLRARRASVWATLAFARARAGASPQSAAQRALDELAAINPRELSDDDAPLYSEAALRVGASRWAALPPLAPPARLTLQAQPGSERGQTCVQLRDPRHAEHAAPLATRCTFGNVWLASARVAADGKTAVVAVQPLEAWTELWVFRATRKGWSLDVLPPALASDASAIGYIEFAGFVPGQARLLVAREAWVDGKWLRRFEVLRLDGGYAAERWAASAQQLAAFSRWPDPQWKQGTVSLR